MSLQEILDHRRAIRHYDPQTPLDRERVKECLRMTALVPARSSPSACPDQLTVLTARERVVFVTPRRDLCRQRAEAARNLRRGNRRAVVHKSCAVDPDVGQRGYKKWP